MSAAAVNLAPYHLGGSEAAVALGMSKFKTAQQLYLEKRGELVRDEVDSEVIWWGRALEPIVRQRYAEETGYVVVAPRGEDGKGLIRSKRYPFMTAHVDGIVVDAGDPIRGYEGKTAFHSMGWGEEGTDEIPRDYLLQVHHYLVVTELPVFDVPVLIGRKFATYQVAADKEIADMIVEGEDAFIGRLERGDPPGFDYQHPSTIELLKRVYKGTNGARLLADETAAGWRTRLAEAAAARNAAKKDEDEAKAQLLGIMGDAAVLAFPDGMCYRRKLVERAAYAVEAANYIDFRLVKDGKGVPGTR